MPCLPMVGSAAFSGDPPGGVTPLEARAGTRALGREGSEGEAGFGELALPEDPCSFSSTLLLGGWGDASACFGLAAALPDRGGFSLWC